MPNTLKIRERINGYTGPTMAVGPVEDGSGDENPRPSAIDEATRPISQPNPK
jgi:hypothetical protein